MITSTFTFAKRHYDDTFHRLDEAIANAARFITGYLGEESWENTANGQVSNVYYWETMDALRLLMNHPVHAQAKGGQSQWLDGYQVVIAEVLRSYGDGRLDHPLRDRNTA